MRWIVKLTNGSGLLRYWDGEATSEVGAVAKALEANPNHWLLRSWPVSEAELAKIIGDPLGPLFGDVDRPINGGNHE